MWRMARQAEAVDFMSTPRAPLCSAMLVLSLFVTRPAIPAEPPPAAHIGSRLELLVDDWLIDSRRDLSFQLHRPVRAETVLQPEQPWEGTNLGHVSILRDGERYRMYYRGYHNPGFSWSENIVTCYAESRDGIHWIKPNLGLVEWEGSKDNNIITQGQRGAYLTPFRDPRPGVPQGQRYKSLAGNPPRAMISPDGIHWSVLRERPVLPKPRFGISFWDPRRKTFLAYVRAWRPDGNGGRLRSIALATSSDFLAWGDPQLLDFGAVPDAHLYWNTALPYFRAPHLYLGFPMRLVEYRDPETGAVRDWTDALFMVSRDGFRFQQYREAFVRPGLDAHNWQPHVNMLAYGIVPTGPSEISLFLTNAAGGKRHLQRLTLRTDGFVSLRASAREGEFVTKPVIFSGTQLLLNASTSAMGRLRVELQTADGKPIAGHQLDDCRELVGDSLALRVRWKRGADLSSLAGQPVRLRLQMRDADLFALQFR